MDSRHEVKGVKLKLLKLLSDGEYHDKSELCRYADCARGALPVHISSLRKSLPPDETIVCEMEHRKIGYRHVRRLN